MLIGQCGRPCVANVISGYNIYNFKPAFCGIRNGNEVCAVLLSSDHHARIVRPDDAQQHPKGMPFSQPGRHFIVTVALLSFTVCLHRAAGGDTGRQRRDQATFLHLLAGFMLILPPLVYLFLRSRPKVNTGKDKANPLIIQD